MRSSIRQVAAHAQVSRMTVSRVLRGRKGEVNPETYERVLKAVQELDYVPVRSAVQNHHVETNTIGMVPYYRNPARSVVDNVTFQGICDCASQEGYDIFVMLRGEAEWMANREELRFLDRRSDGFIFISPGCGEWQTTLEALLRHSIPTVVCYRRDVPDGVPWVDPDNQKIIQLAVERLVHDGHRNIAYIAGPPRKEIDAGKLPNLSGISNSFDNEERLRHFSLVMRNLGLEQWGNNIVWTADPEWRFAEEELTAMLNSGTTAAIFGGHQAYQAQDLAREMGISVPGDLSIISVDNQREAALRGLTTVGFGYEEVGRLAVQAWLELKEGRRSSDCCRVVPVSLVERQTVAPPQNLNL